MDLGAAFYTIEAPEILADERKQHLPFIAFEEIRPKIDAGWRIKGLLPRRGIGALYGPSGSGKTFVLLDMLMAVARGVPWRGRKTERAGVLYLCPDGGEMVQNRVEAYRLRCGGEVAADFALVPVGIDLLGHVSAGDVERVARLIGFIERLRGWSIGVVALDTVSRAMPGGDENAPKDMTRLIDNLARIASEDRSVIGVHHTPKSDATVLRGHSALHGACDFEINVADRAITIAKQRDGEAGRVFGFALDVVEIGRDEEGDPVTSCVAVEADAPDGRSSGRGRLSHTDAVALETIKNLIAEHGEPLPQGTGFPSGGQRLGVSSSAALQALKGNIYTDKEPEAARKAWERVRAKLQRFGLIGVCGGIVWSACDRMVRTRPDSVRNHPAVR